MYALKKVFGIAGGCGNDGVVSAAGLAGAPVAESDAYTGAVIIRRFLRSIGKSRSIGERGVAQALDVSEYGGHCGLDDQPAFLNRGQRGVAPDAGR